MIPRSIHVIQKSPKWATTLNAERMFQKESEFLKKAAPVNSGKEDLWNYTFFIL